MPEKSSIFSTIFLTPEQGRLRSGWRLFGQSMLLLIFFMVFTIPATFFYQPDLENLADLMIISTIVGVPAITASVYLARRLLDRRSFVSLGLLWNVQAVKDLFFGIGLAGLMMAIIYLVHWGAGWLIFDGFAWDIEAGPVVASTLLIWLLIFILVGWYEELLTRGYWLQNLAEGLNLFWAVFISSAAFAILHLFNPHTSSMSAIGLLAAGVFLAYGYLRTKLLWLPVGLHIGWNFFQGNVFGFPVSGIETYSLIEHSLVGPEIVTGGAFGPEAGLILFPVLLIGFGSIKWYTKNRQTTP